MGLNSVSFTRVLVGILSLLSQVQRDVVSVFPEVALSFPYIQPAF